MFNAGLPDVFLALLNTVTVRVCHYLSCLVCNYVGSVLILVTVIK